MNLFSFSQERSGVALSNKIRNKTNPLQKLYLKTVKIAISSVSQYCENILYRFSLKLDGIIDVRFLKFSVQFSENFTENMLSYEMSDTFASWV